jgi:short-subunit dehydrogenase
MKQHSKGLAVITGASSGIGAVYADRLARRGYDLLLVARNQGRMADLATRLANETGSDVDILAADLTNSNDLARVEQFLRDDPRVTVLVNNAGVGATAPLLNSDVDDMSLMIKLNVEALTRLTYAIVPAFVKRGAGMIINIASIVAIAPERLNGV